MQFLILGRLGQRRPAHTSALSRQCSRGSKVSASAAASFCLPRSCNLFVLSKASGRCWLARELFYPPLWGLSQCLPNNALQRVLVCPCLSHRISRIHPDCQSPLSNGAGSPCRTAQLVAKWPGQCLRSSVSWVPNADNISQQPKNEIAVCHTLLQGKSGVPRMQGLGRKIQVSHGP